MGFTPPTHTHINTYTHITNNLSALAPTPPSHLPGLVCVPFLLAVPLSLSSPFSGSGDIQALANLNTFAKQYLRLHVSQFDFVVFLSSFPMYGFVQR